MSERYNDFRRMDVEYGYYWQEDVYYPAKEDTKLNDEVLENFKIKVYNRSAYFRRLWGEHSSIEDFWKKVRDIFTRMAIAFGDDRDAMLELFYCSPFYKHLEKEYGNGKIKKRFILETADESIKFLVENGSGFFEDDHDLNKIRETPNNDYGNALLFIYCFGDYVRYVKEENSWCTYNRGYWQIKSDDKFNVAQKCLTMYERFGIAVKSLSDADVSKRRHLALGNQRTIKNLIEQLKLLVNTSANMFEKNKELIAVNNGVLSLRDGSLEDADPNFYITDYVDVDYLEGEKAKRFIQFIDEIFDGDRELINYVQKLLGYCMTAETKEQALFLFHGRASNGKSVLVKVLRSLLGDLCKTLTVAALAKKEAQNEINTSLYQARRSRLVFSNENEADMRFNMSLLKQVTGEDSIRVRTLYKTPVEFTAKFKMIVVSNPILDLGLEQASMRRRVKVVPFNVTFTDKYTQKTIVDGRTYLPKDVDLYNKLMAERYGIFNWLIEGAVKWYKEGLGEEPEAMKKAFTMFCKEAESKNKVDNVKKFVNEEVVFTGNSEDRLMASEFYEAFQEWCELADENVINITAFGKSLRKMEGFEKKKIDGRVYYVGLRFRDEKD